MVFDKRPQLCDGIWLADGPTKRVGFVLSNKDMFVLLEVNEANDCCYPKILTTDGIVGYLYLHNDNEVIESTTPIPPFKKHITSFHDIPNRHFFEQFFAFFKHLRYLWQRSFKLICIKSCSF